MMAIILTGAKEVAMEVRNVRDHNDLTFVLAGRYMIFNPDGKKSGPVWLTACKVPAYGYLLRSKCRALYLKCKRKYKNIECEGEVLNVVALLHGDDLEYDAIAIGPFPFVTTDGSGVTFEGELNGYWTQLQNLGLLKKEWCEFVVTHVDYDSYESEGYDGDYSVISVNSDEE